VLGPVAVSADPVRLVTERLVVRTGRADDAPVLAAFHRENRAFLAPFEPVPPEGCGTEAFWARQIEINSEEFRRDRSLRLFLFDRGDDRTVLGKVNFTQFFRGPFQACMLGYSLGERSEGRGLMREALEAAVGHVFDHLRMHRIQANYMPHNRRSGATLRALGFVVEGYARDYLQVAGRWEDHVLTSLTNSGWRPP